MLWPKPCSWENMIPSGGGGDSHPPTDSHHQFCPQGAPVPGYPFDQSASVIRMIGFLCRILGFLFVLFGPWVGRSLHLFVVGASLGEICPPPATETKVVRKAGLGAGRQEGQRDVMWGRTRTYWYAQAQAGAYVDRLKPGVLAAT